MHANRPVHYSVVYKEEGIKIKATAYKKKRDPTLRGELCIENSDSMVRRLDFESGVAVRLTEQTSIQFLAHPHQNWLKELVLREFASCFKMLFSPNGTLRSKLPYFSELEQYIN